MTSTADFVVPGAGPMEQALATILELCNGMEEAQTACVSLHARLLEVFQELQAKESKEKLPSASSLEQFVAATTRFLRYLQRLGGKSLVFRIVEHWTITSDLLEINQDVSKLFELFEIAGSTNWKDDWEDDISVMKQVLTATSRDNAVVLRDLQDSRSQREALLILRFELEQRAARHDEAIVRLMKSIQATIAMASRGTEDVLPPWFLPSSDIEVEPMPFASGSFGSVHRGVWGPGTKVVVKRFLVEDKVIGPREQLRIEKEINIWHQLNHPNVIKMFGASHVSSPPFIVCEDATNGDLGAYLVRSGSNKQEMWRLLHQAALGLDYIHKKNVVHGDLKLNNILIGADGLAKLSDFGLSTIRTCSTLSKGAEMPSGGLRWRAPECLKKRPTFASDVYSLAMCMIEAVIGEPPFAFLDDASVRENLKGGIRPERPDELNRAEWKLVVDMTNMNASKRIPLHRVIERLAALEDPDISALTVDSDSESSSDSEGSSENVSNAASTSSSFQFVTLEEFDKESYENVKAWIESKSRISEPVVFVPYEQRSIKELVQLVRSGAHDERLEATKTLSRLAQENDSNRKSILREGGAEALRDLAQRGTVAAMWALDALGQPVQSSCYRNDRDYGDYVEY